MPLKQYNKKRDFSKTAEPKGKVSNKDKYLFVVQKHAASHLHYDFRLELNGVLLSWAVPKGPCLDPSVKRLAMHVEDHPVAYGHFEGIIPKGEYGGGTVMLWDIGKWIPEDDDPVKAYKKGHLRFILKGKKLKGAFSLVRMKDDKAWLLIKGKDKYAKPLSEYDILQAKPKSVLTNKTMDQLSEQYTKVWGKTGAKKRVIKKEPRKTVKKKFKIDLPTSSMPRNIHPQLATLVDTAPDTADWLHELKFDGYRILAFKQGKNVRLMTRNQNNWTDSFKNVAHAIKNLAAKNIVLDGEMVLLDEDGKSSFQLLQNSTKQHKNPDFIYYIFDIIFYEKYNLKNLPLIERKEILAAIIADDAESALRLSSFIIGSGKEIFKKSCRMGMEGIVSKEIDSVYEEKRTKTWLKVKCVQRQEFVIGGYTRPQGSREGFGSLFLGTYNNKKELVFCGNVGTGFTQASLKTIYKKLQRYRSSTNPFTTRPPGVTTAIWVKPKLVCEVEFIEWTSDGNLRHPSFKGLRADKPAFKIKKEREMSIKNIAAGAPAFLTHPKKVLYPEDGVTKLDLVNYYDTVKKWMLPYITNRPLTLVRCPDTYKECFYQKHLNKFSPQDVESVSIKEKTKTDQYPYITNITGLLSLVQLGVLEFHIWGSDVKKVNYPNMIVFDLDPSPEVAWKKVVAAAKLLKKELAKLKLKSFVKTTGGKGLHVVVPIKPEHDWDDIKNFSHAFVNHIVELFPEEYVSTISKAKRKGKIFVDYLRNQKGATAIAPYSTRARKGAPVSVPLRWEELSNRFEDNYYTIFTLPKRLKKLRQDPWKDFNKTRQSIKL